jgi:hypothetical protein
MRPTPGVMQILVWSLAWLWLSSSWLVSYLLGLAVNVEGDQGLVEQITGENYTGRLFRSTIHVKHLSKTPERCG